jgi:phosphate-selective porin OprO and OprP
MFRRSFVPALPVALAAFLTSGAAAVSAQTPAPAQSPAQSPATSPAPEAAPAPAAAETAPANPQTPEERIQALDQQLRILARQIEIDKEAAAAAQATAPVAVAGAGGFEIRTPDSAFRLRIRGYLHADSRYYGNDDDNRGVDTFLLRRARPILEATFFKIFDFRIMSDFGGGTAVVQDA